MDGGPNGILATHWHMLPFNSTTSDIGVTLVRRCSGRSPRLSFEYACFVERRGRVVSSTAGVDYHCRVAKEVELNSGKSTRTPSTSCHDYGKHAATSMMHMRLTIVECRRLLAGIDRELQSVFTQHLLSTTKYAQSTPIGDGYCLKHGSQTSTALQADKT